MPVSNNSPAPYAPAQQILDIIGRYRNTGMMTPFTSEVLSRASVPDSLIPRTLQALRVLDLIKEDGMPTETLDGLRRSKEPEFKANLAAWIQGAYAEVFAFVKPNDEATAIRDAFRAYNPVGQQDRMVSLFIGLCRAADLRTEEADAKEGRPRPQPRKASVAPATASVKRSTAPKQKASPAPQIGAMPPALAGLLSSLPTEGGMWTKEERDKFVTTFGAVLDFCFRVVDNPIDI